MCLGTALASAIMYRKRGLLAQSTNHRRIQGSASVDFDHSKAERPGTGTATDALFRASIVHFDYDIVVIIVILLVFRCFLVPR